MMGLPPEIFKRLSRLNRELVHDQLRTADRLGPRPTEARAAAPAAAEAVSLEALIPGQERLAPGGRLYVVQRQAEELRPAAGSADETESGGNLLARYRRIFFGSAMAVSPDDLPEPLRPLVAAHPERVTYLDIETCGLAGEPLFLIGLMRYRGATLRIDQFLARDYSEERPLLEAFWTELGGTECVVTFNGKTFDLPAIQARSMACGIFESPSIPAHVDLLHEARRRWKRELPNCRLQTLEQLICRRFRAGDIPGADIPAAYHDFVRARQGGDMVRRAQSLRRLQIIMHHNALDLVTMAELVTHILESGA